MHIHVFEDEFVDQLYPISTGRPAYAISCASFRLVDWLIRLGHPVSGAVRPHLETHQELDFPELGRQIDKESELVLVVNARVVPSRSAIDSIRNMIRQERVGVVRNGSHLAAAVVTQADLIPTRSRRENRQQHPVSAESLDRLPLLGSELDVFRHPHDLIRFNLSAFPENIETRIETGNYREIREGVYLADGARIGDYVITDTSEGPIVLEAGASVGPYCYLSGPAYLGRNARVIEHSAIKDAVSLGHTTKIGGEVEASVIEPYTNKQHHGFLGHSYLGSWINLGAGTCNSDLKNTYGEVKMEYRGERVPTGMQFVGCMMGDYSKSAINTGVFTGKTIGVCSMLYGFVTTNVPSFVNYARLFGQVTEMSPQVMVATQARMFKRRNVTQRPCDIQLLHDMFELTRDERQLAGEPLVL